MPTPALELVPFTYPTPTGRPPVVDRLALFGAPSPAIGAVVCATSDIDVHGCWVKDPMGNVIPEGGPRGGLKWWHVLVALLPIAPMAAILGALVGHALEPKNVRAQDAYDLTTPFAVIFGVIAFGLSLYLFSRKRWGFRMGRAVVLGTEGFEATAYSAFGDSKPHKHVVRYDDPSRVWTVRAEEIRGGRRSGLATEVISVHDVRTGEVADGVVGRIVSRPGSWAPDPFDEENEIVFLRILESATRAKTAFVQAAHRAGQPAAFPIVGGTGRRLLLSRDALHDEQNGQVRTLPLSRLRVSVANGVYTFAADDGGPPIILDRDRIGDVFVLEAFLGLRG